MGYETDRIPQFPDVEFGDEIPRLITSGDAFEVLKVDPLAVRAYRLEGMGAIDERQDVILNTDAEVARIDIDDPTKVYSRPVLLPTNEILDRETLELLGFPHSLSPDDNNGTHENFIKLEPTSGQLKEINNADTKFDSLRNFLYGSDENVGAYEAMHKLEGAITEIEKTMLTTDTGTCLTFDTLEIKMKWLNELLLQRKDLISRKE